MNTRSGGKAPQIIATHVVALYRPNDGRVMHLHTVQVFEGGRNVSKEEAEEELKVNATRFGHDIEALKIAHIEKYPKGHGRLYYDSVNNTLKQTVPKLVRRRGSHN